MHSFSDRDLEVYPLLKLFTDNSYSLVVVYDARANEFITLNQKEFNALKIFDSSKSTCTKTIYEKTIHNYVDDGFFLEGPLTQRICTDKSYIKKLLENDFYKQPIGGLCLEVTTNCNLRCSYCPFTIELLSENNKESNARKHGSKNMSYEIALKAIGFYFEELKKRSRSFKEGQKPIPTLTFYGGEPLLRFDLIITCVKEFKSKPWKSIGLGSDGFLVSLTTNLTTDNKRILDDLVENDIDILVSIDGPQKENDKNRVFANSDRSVHKKVMENLEYIYLKAPVYFEKRVHFSAVYAPGHNLDEIINFFSQKNTASFSDLMTGTRVHHATAQYFACPDSINFTCEDSKAWQNASQFSAKQLANVADKEQLERWKSQNVFNNSMYKIFYDFEFRPRFRNQGNLVNTAPTCIPGIRKIFMSVNGNIHACERTDHSMPIGNVNCGYDIELIRKLLSSYFDIMNSERCRRCWGFRFCQFCPAPLINKGKIIKPSKDDCSKFLNNVDDLLCKYLVVKFQKPNLLETIKN